VASDFDDAKWERRGTGHPLSSPPTYPLPCPHPTRLSTASCSSPRSCAFPRRAIIPNFFCPRVEEEVASTTQDQSGNSSSTAEHHDGPCSSSRSLSEVMSCSSFFSLGGGGGRNALETMDTTHHLHMLILPSLSPLSLSLSTHELIAQARPHICRFWCLAEQVSWWICVRQMRFTSANFGV
jgi:hypothetical protein